MVQWPLPEHSLPRRRLLAHELYHRLQDDLDLPGNSPQNPQLDTLEPSRYASSPTAPAACEGFGRQYKLSR
jgi:hypothetical protein